MFDFVFEVSGRCCCAMADLADSVARRYAVLRRHLSGIPTEVWLGASAAELGPGGVGIVAAATGVAADAVRRGRKMPKAGPPGFWAVPVFRGGLRNLCGDRDTLTGWMAAVEAEPPAVRSFTAGLRRNVDAVLTLESLRRGRGHHQPHQTTQSNDVRAGEARPAAQAHILP